MSNTVGSSIAERSCSVVVASVGVARGSDGGDGGLRRDVGGVGGDGNAGGMNGGVGEAGGETGSGCSGGWRGGGGGVGGRGGCVGKPGVRGERMQGPTPCSPQEMPHTSAMLVELGEGNVRWTAR